MFKLIGEAYETLNDPRKREEYNLMRKGGRTTYSGNDESSHFSNFHDEYSFSRAFDLFNSMFNDINNDFFVGAFNAPFERNTRRREGPSEFRPRSFGHNHPFFGQNDPFSDPFFNMTANDGFGGGFSSFGSGFSSFASSSGGTSRSVSTTTTIGPDGRRSVRKETTIVHADGSRETTVEESSDSGSGTRTHAIASGPAGMGAGMSMETGFGGLLAGRNLSRMTSVDSGLGYDHGDGRASRNPNRLMRQYSDQHAGQERHAGHMRRSQNVGRNF